MKIFLVILSFVILMMYAFTTIFKEDRIPTSIGSIYRSLKFKGWASIVPWVSSGLLVWPMMTVEGSIPFWVLLALSGMVLIGVAANPDNKIEKILQSVGGVMAFVGSQAWIFGIKPYLLAVWFLPIIISYALIHVEYGSFKQRLVNSCVISLIEVSAISLTYICLLLSI